MAQVQTEYRERILAGVNGMPANTDRLRIKSFELQAGAAAIPFGRAVQRGATDESKIVIGAGTGAFVGFTMLDRTLQASQDDMYVVGDIAGVLQEGEIFVTVEVAVEPGNPVSVRADDGRPSAIANRGAWASGTDYVVNDVVSSGANWYRANRAHTSASGNVADGSPAQAMATAWDLAVNQIVLSGVSWESEAAAGALARVRMAGVIGTA